jgi:hypothetical protein
LLLLALAQDVAHARRGTMCARPASTSRSPIRGGRSSGVDRLPVSGVYRGWDNAKHA